MCSGLVISITPIWWFGASFRAGLFFFCPLLWNQLVKYIYLTFDGFSDSKTHTPPTQIDRAEELDYCLSSKDLRMMQRDKTKTEQKKQSNKNNTAKIRTTYNYNLHDGNVKILSCYRNGDCSISCEKKLWKRNLFRGKMPFLAFFEYRSKLMKIRFPSFSFPFFEKIIEWFMNFIL